MEIIKIINILKKRYNPTGKLNQDYKSFNPFEVLISTILSQRTRDENTEKASRRLFFRFNTPKKLANAKIRDIENLIRPSGFYKVKARRIREVSRIILNKYNGKVPSEEKELLSLSGVGRKTMACTRVYGFGIPELPIDTHCHRIPNRLGWIKTKTPLESEDELKRIIHKKYWLDFNELFVKFGQDICQPRKPLCSKCPIGKLCDFENKNLNNSITNT